MADAASNLALSMLELPAPNEYFIAFGPEGRQFCAAPTGYSATCLPAQVRRDILNGHVRKVSWAAFGSEENSFHFSYETKHGTTVHRTGEDTPKGLKRFVDQVVSGAHARSLRVQLGHEHSWLAWAGGFWASLHVPASLLSALKALSGNDASTATGCCNGVLKSGVLSSVTWLRDGTYYIKAEGRWAANFETEMVRSAWSHLWRNGEDLSMLAHVSFDPHSSGCDTFAFIKAAQPDKKADFVVHFGAEGMISRLSDVPNENPTTQTVHVPSVASAPQTHQWAIAKHGGRGHAADDWELDLKKGEQLVVVRYEGKDWFIVQNMNGVRGHAHRSSLEFGEMRRHVDPRVAYALWQQDSNELLKRGELRWFPKLSGYMDICKKAECAKVKEEPLGICAHDLMELLRGSGQYSVDFLKSQRNTWHPDKFARFCHVEQREELKAQAQALFVMFNALIDLL